MCTPRWRLRLLLLDEKHGCKIYSFHVPGLRRHAVDSVEVWICSDEVSVVISTRKHICAEMLARSLLKSGFVVEEVDKSSDGLYRVYASCKVCGAELRQVLTRLAKTLQEV